MSPKKTCDLKTFQLVVLAALKHHEISEGRAVELLGWSRHKIREQQDLRVGRVKPGTLVEALDIMDTYGRKVLGAESTMLWNKEWEELRGMILENLDAARALEEAEDE